MPTPLRALLLGILCLSAGAENKVIYGQDDRLDVYQVSDENLLALADSVCGVVRRGDLDDLGNGTFRADTSFYSVCPQERFAGQRELANCTAFLVADNVVATAGHCLNADNLHLWRFVFGYEMLDASTPVTIFDESQVYTGTQVIAWNWNSVDDWALVRLDRPVTAPGAVPLAVRESGLPSVGTGVGMIGHPSGLPLKIAFGNSTFIRKSANAGFFEANLDAYGGNSGSPVFNRQTGVVEGILVRGQLDFVQSGNCLVSNVLSDGSGFNGEFEDVSRATRFAHLIPVPGPGGPADVNGDTYIDAADLQIVINVVLGVDTNPEADVDENGFFNAADIQLVVLYLLGEIA